MALHEPLRSSIRERFRELLGPDEAGALMAEFPDHEDDRPITVGILDLRLSESEARTGERIEALRGEMVAMGADLRSEMATMSADLHADLQELDVRVARLEERVVALPAEVTKLMLFWFGPIWLATTLGVFGLARAGG